MSAFTWNPAQGIGGLCMTPEEFLALGELPERYELQHGVVVMSPSASGRHQRVAARFVAAIENWSDAHEGQAQLIPDHDTRIGEHSVYRPDVKVLRRGRGEHGRSMSGTPALVIEILSPSSRALDLVTKLADYGDAGVEEYWVVDPATVEVRVWRRVEGALAVAETTGGMLRSSAFPTLEIDLPRVARGI